MSDDPKISERYRELPREEPPRALDDAILAASRRAVEAHPAPLVAPTGRRRWYFPVAAAAVITLAVAVTLHIQHDRPGEEVDAVTPPMKVQEVPKAREVPKAEAPRQAPPRAARRDSTGAGFTPDPKPQAAPAPAPAPARAPAAAEPELAAEEKRSSADRQGAPARQASSPASVVGARPRTETSRVAAQAESPEQMLERIARLRAAGRHAEADKALAEFRKRYPDYRIAPAMLERVEPK